MLQKATSSNSESLHWLCLHTTHENLYCVHVESHICTLIELFAVVLIVLWYLLGSFPFQWYQSITHSNTMKGLLFKWKKQTKFHPMLQVNWPSRNSRKVFSGFHTKAIKSKHSQTSKDVSPPPLHEYTSNSNLSFYMRFKF